LVGLLPGRRSVPAHLADLTDLLTYGTVPDLIQALRTTGATRQFRPDPVADQVLERILDNARFAPSGGNRQGWHVVVVRDPDERRQIRDLYLEGWYEYLAMSAVGLVPWAPVTDRMAEDEAAAKAREFVPPADAGGFAEHLDEVPVLLLVAADLRALAAVDRDLDRYSLNGGASIYPFCWSILLAAREEGLGGVITTMVVKREDAVRELVGLPPELAVACLIALGVPEHQPRRLTRRAVSEFTTIDRYEGQPFGASG
jgi:nitroreductase